MNIEVAGVKIAFGTVLELQEALKRKSAELDREIEDHEAKALSLRKTRKEVLKIIGGKQDGVNPSSAGTSEA
jgi:uncharacterized protein YeeX (DUF496 family)